MVMKSMINMLIEQYQAYLHLQHRISKAIYHQDEGLLDQLKVSSQNLFLKIEANRKDLVETSEIDDVRESSFLAGTSQLVMLMEQAQRQVQENEIGLQRWLSQMQADIQQYRSAQSPRGVLASYIQQKQTPSHRITQSVNTPTSSPQVAVVPAVTNSPGPWKGTSQPPKTVGHHLNEQS
jgi:hypothetical protein